MLKLIPTEVMHHQCPLLGEIVAKVNYPQRPHSDQTFGARPDKINQPPKLKVYGFRCDKCGAVYDFPPGKPNAAEEIEQRLGEEWRAENLPNLSARLKRDYPQEKLDEIRDALSNIELRDSTQKQKGPQTTADPRGQPEIKFANTDPPEPSA